MIAALTLLLAGCWNYGAVSSGPDYPNRGPFSGLFYCSNTYIYLYKLKTTFGIIFFRNGEPA